MQTALDNNYVVWVDLTFTSLLFPLLLIIISDNHIIGRVVVWELKRHMGLSEMVKIIIVILFPYLGFIEWINVHMQFIRHLMEVYCERWFNEFRKCQGERE